MGTSYAAPLTLRSAVGIRAVLGKDIHPLTIKALLIHGSKIINDNNLPKKVEWGCIPSNIKELITCNDNTATIVYQGILQSGKYLRAQIPLPNTSLNGLVNIKATLCYACHVDPQDAAAYTKAGLTTTFRPDVNKVNPDQKTPPSKTFFSKTKFATEEKLRNDLQKWETVLHGNSTFRGSSISKPVFDIHYIARDTGGPEKGHHEIPYALIVTISASNHPNIYQDIIDANEKLKIYTPIEIGIDIDQI